VKDVSNIYRIYILLIKKLFRVFFLQRQYVTYTAIWLKCICAINWFRQCEVFIADLNDLHDDDDDDDDVVVAIVVVVVAVAGSEYVRASSMRDVRPLNNAENSGKKKMKVVRR